MADKKVDVGVRLKMEQADAAASEVDKLRKRVLELEGSTHKAETSFLDLAKQAAAMTLAVNVMPAIHQVLDFGKSLVEAAMHAESTDRAIAGLITSVQGLPLEQARTQATGYRQDLEDIAVAAGVAQGDVEGAFQAMVEMRGATNEGLAASRESVERLSIVSQTLGKSVEGISREFGFMSEGVLRTRGQLFQLLQTTGIFGNNTKKAAEYWSKLTEEDRIKALDFGLSRIAGSMAKAEPSAGALLTSIENLYETAKERLGESLLKELVPVLTEVKMRMMAAIPAIEKFAHEVGPEVGKWVSMAVSKIEAGFQYLRTHSQEIHDTIVSAFEKAKGVIDFIIANKDLIAIAFGAKTVAPAIGTAISAGKTVLGGAQAAAGAMGIAGAAGTAATLATFGIAVAAFAAAVYAFGKFLEIRAEGQKQHENAMASLESISKMAEAGNVQAVEKMTGNFKRMALAVDGELDPALETALQHIHSIAETSERMKSADLSQIQREIDTAVSKMKELPETTAAIASVQGQKKADDYSQQMVMNQVTLLIDAYNEATRVGSTAMQGMAIQTITSSKVLEDAFLKSSMDVQGGLEKFADIVLGGGSQFAGFAAAIRGKAGAGAKVPAAPAVHMSGGQTFKITQDFREADPDRVALVFERDMVKLAENRIQARTTIPFGG